MQCCDCCPLLIQKYRKYRLFYQAGRSCGQPHRLVIFVVIVSCLQKNSVTLSHMVFYVSTYEIQSFCMYKYRQLIVKYVTFKHHISIRTGTVNVLGQYVLSDPYVKLNYCKKVFYFSLNFLPWEFLLIKSWILKKLRPPSIQLLKLIYRTTANSFQGNYSF